MREDRMIVQCPYCSMTTGGQHEYGCPNYSQPVVHIELFPKDDTFLARSRQLETENAALRRWAKAWKRAAKRWWHEWHNELMPRTNEALDQAEYYSSEAGKLCERVAELEAAVEDYHQHIMGGTLVWQIPPTEYHGEGVA